MSHLWTAADFAKAVEPISQPGEIGDVDGVSIDSRSIGEGDAFFAIKGDRFDGHAFARSALKAGAAVVVLEEAQRDDFADISERVVFVDDVLKALERLGRAARTRAQGKIIAITGSVGKTSTKDALRKALEPSGKVHAAVASFNNHWGVPLTLARMHADSDFGVFEVGMNQSGEIRTLIDMVRPDIAIVTTVVAAHIGNFDSIDDIAAAKAEIFEGVVSGGIALINGDNEFGAFLGEKAKACDIERVYRFGSADEFEAKLLDAEFKSNGSDLTVSLFGDSHQVHLAAPGAHLAHNSLAVLAAVHLAGANVPAAIAKLGSHGATKGRGERHELCIKDGIALLIDESYNANPSSVSAALETLGLGSDKAAGRRIAVLGDMLELGSESAEIHADLLDDLVKAELDQAYLCGPMMHHLWERLPKAMQAGYGERSEDLIAPLKDNLQPGDMVMVKGSLGSRMGLIVASLLESYKN